MVILSKQGLPTDYLPFAICVDNGKIDLGGEGNGVSRKK